MTNPVKFAVNPLAENTLSMAEITRQLFNPSKAEIAASAKRRAVNAAAIRAGIARLKAKGF